MYFLPRSLIKRKKETNKQSHLFVSCDYLYGPARGVQVTALEEEEWGSRKQEEHGEERRDCLEEGIKSWNKKESICIKVTQIYTKYLAIYH